MIHFSPRPINPTEPLLSDRSGYACSGPDNSRRRTPRQCGEGCHRRGSTDVSSSIRMERFRISYPSPKTFRLNAGSSNSFGHPSLLSRIPARLQSSASFSRSIPPRPGRRTSSTTGFPYFVMTTRSPFSAADTSSERRAFA